MMTGQLKEVILCMHFGDPQISGFRVSRVPTISWMDAIRHRQAHAILCANPSTLDLAKLHLLRLASLGRIRTAVFDLILKKPESIRERFIAQIKSILLRSIDQFLMIHRDWTGYCTYFGIDPSRCRYIPFKANNLDLAKSLPSVDHGYVLACGASHRDFNTFMKAVASIDCRAIIMLSDTAAHAHRALFDPQLLPPNVERISSFVDRARYNRLIAEASIVVVPIVAGTIQPAGISVCLEAMALGKPVIATRGSSTEGVLDEHLAVIVPPGDPEELARAIRDLMQDPRRREELSRNGRRFAADLQGDDRLARDICNQFRELCSRA